VFLKHIDEITSVSVGPRLEFEVLPECGFEIVVPNVVEELLQHGRSFALSDAVEGFLSLLCGGVLVGDSVSGTQAVSAICL